MSLCPSVGGLCLQIVLKVVYHLGRLLRSSGMALPVLEGNGLFLLRTWSARLQSGEHKMTQVRLGGWSSTFFRYKVFRSAVPPHWVNGSFWHH